MRIISGVQPSGTLHLGNYFGAIEKHLELQHQYQCLYFIADLHALTTIHDAKLLQEYSFNVAVDYLTLGLDPEKAIFFRQSDVPEVLELSWILGTTAGKGLLDRAHSYKDKVAKGITPSIGLYYYPLLMAADILLYQAQGVPVGQDQKQHIEMTQDFAQTFNHVYKKELLKRPEPIFTTQPKVPGIDGEKMSKSYNNTIAIFASEKESKQRFSAIKTDSLPLEAPKDPDACILMSFMRLFANADEVKAWEEKYRRGGMGYGAVKSRLVELYEQKFGVLREKRAQLLAERNTVEEILQNGAKRARSIAQQTMKNIREVVGLFNNNC